MEPNLPFCTSKWRVKSPKGNDMAAFLSNQLDFIFFFYGLAFILLGATCWTVARSQGGGEAWAMLGAFGFAHGIGEWLDLTALIVFRKGAAAAV